MDFVINIVLFILGLLALMTILFVYVPFIIKMYKRWQASVVSNEQVKVLLSDFLMSQQNISPGKDFVKLIRYGFFQCRKTGNHGKDFPTDKQRASFMKYATPEIAQAVKEIGDSI